MSRRNLQNTQNISAHSIQSEVRFLSLYHGKREAIRKWCQVTFKSYITHSTFTKKAVGLDIADHTIEVVELEKSLFSPLPSIVSRARIPLEKGIVEHGRLANKKQLLDALSSVWEHGAPKPLLCHDVIVGVPERQVYTSVISIETPKGISVNERVEDAAHAIIPLEKDDLAYSYRIIGKKENASEVLLYGTSREVLGEWRDFFENSPYHVRAFDHELLAIVRGLFGRAEHQPVCIVDCGAERTKIAVYSATGLQYVHALDIAGDIFTDQLAKSLDVSKDEAEKIKKEEGMEPLPRRAFFEKLLEPIIHEAVTACDFYEKGSNSKVAEIILVGGSVRLKGLPEFFAEKMGRTVRRGSSFLEIRGTEKEEDQLQYIEAIGLALKGIQPQIWEAEHPSLTLD